MFIIEYKAGRSGDGQGFRQAKKERETEARVTRSAAVSEVEAVAMLRVRHSLSLDEAWMIGFYFLCYR